MIQIGPLLTGSMVAAVVLATAVLTQLGISLNEALYLSVLGFTVTSYSITAWRLRQEE